MLATDHAPHLASEKAEPYTRAPSGLPLVQYALQCAIERVLDGKLTLERVVEAVSHAPATLVQCARARLSCAKVISPISCSSIRASHIAVSAADVLSKCGWSPFEGYTFRSSIAATFVNGQLGVA